MGQRLSEVAAEGTERRINFLAQNSEIEKLQHVFERDEDDLDEQDDLDRGEEHFNE